MMSNGATTAAAEEAMRRYPFTANQWQELEHQALVYKYIISGIPIPPHLLFSIKTSPHSKPMLHHPPNSSLGWKCCEMGFGRKIDPEPGRCKRTDGKKWRCSKQAFTDSKYCERHMHRGRNRSRKPVEVNPNNSKSTPPPAAIPISSKSQIYPSSMASADSHNLHNSSSFLYSQSTSSRIMGFPSLSSQETFLLDSASYSHSDKDYRNNNGHGMMKDEHPFLSETSRNVSDSWHLEPLTMESSMHRTCSDIQNDYSYLQSKQQKQDEQQQYYHEIGLKMEREEEEEDEPQKVMHHFFDEWPHKNSDTSSTQLSISMPISSHDFFITPNDK